MPCECEMKICKNSHIRIVPLFVLVSPDISDAVFSLAHRTHGTVRNERTTGLHNVLALTRRTALKVHE